MKLKVYWLTTDLENCGTETTVFASEKEQEAAMAAIITERIEEARNDNEPAVTLAVADECERLLAVITTESRARLGKELLDE